jgi:hypothetical protein
MLLAIILPFIINAQEAVKEDKPNKNSFTIDVGYAYSNQATGGLLGKKKVNSGMFQQFQYSRNVYKFFDVYAGFQTAFIFPTKHSIYSSIFNEDYTYTERENSFSTFVGFNFIPVAKKVEWKISQETGFSHFVNNSVRAVLVSISEDEPDINALFTYDVVYNSIHYGVGSSITYKISDRIALGITYKANLAIKLGPLENEFDSRLFLAGHNLGFRTAVKF